MWSFTWWKDVGERAIRTFANALVAWVLVAGNTVGVEDLNWIRGVSISGISALLSILTSIGASSVTGSGPSFASVYEEKRGKHDSGN